MCVLNNRKFIGTELSKEYCDIAIQRIKTAQGEHSIQKLFTDE
jgi:DNA modification methylase